MVEQGTNDDPTQEQDRLDALCEPLFELFLRFQNAFARAAIDKMKVSDEDAEQIAQMMEGRDESRPEGSPIGRAFAYLMRHIARERLLRTVSHEPAIGWNDPSPGNTADKGLN